ncbi:hypothetical protein DL96DRAFT_1705286 [Flagelloscypha sp. PMI_526]|nr:hypothetical protein DL96DRAFT_1705286 [Flagelloscypha sp. PMI_526]
MEAPYMVEEDEVKFQSSTNWLVHPRCLFFNGADYWFNIGWCHDVYENPAIVLTTAGAPLLAALTFGRQRDIVSVWMFWNPPSHDTQQGSSKKSMDIV